MPNLVHSVQEIPTLICNLQKELKVKKEYLTTDEEEKSEINKQVSDSMVLTVALSWRFGVFIPKISQSYFAFLTV